MSHLVFILYHKTGYILSKLLEHVAVSETGAARGWSAPSRKCLCSERGCESGEELDVARWPSPELLLSPAPLPSCFYVVHMVRDPARWALSFYDYHSQTPTPEHWVEESSRHPYCGPKTAEFAEALGLREPLLGSAIAACDELTTPSWTYLQHLQRLPERDGLRFMAFMNLFGRDGGGQVGDMLRAAANAAALRRGAGSGARVLTFSMDEMATSPEISFAQLAAFVADAAAAAPRGRRPDAAWVHSSRRRSTRRRRRRTPRRRRPQAAPERTPSDATSPAAAPPRRARRAAPA